MEGLPSTRSILSSALEDIKGASKILGKIAVPIVFAHAAVGAFVIGFSLEASGFRASGPIAMSAFDSPWIRILQTAMQLVGLFVNIYFIDTLVRIVNRSIDEDATVSDALKHSGPSVVTVRSMICGKRVGMRIALYILNERSTIAQERREMSAIKCFFPCTWRRW